MVFIRSSERGCNPMKDYFVNAEKCYETYLWVNNATAADAITAIENGAINATTNPAFLSKLIKTPEKALLEQVVSEYANKEQDVQMVVDQTQLYFVKRLADIFLPLYQKQPGRCGFVSIQGNPHLDEDADNMLEEALRYRELAENILPKIPIIPAGIQTIRALVERNIPSIATEVMSMAQVKAICDAYVEAAERSGNRPTLFLTHITGIFDEYLQMDLEAKGIELPKSLLEKAGTYVAMKEFAYLQNLDYPIVLLGGGARKMYHFTNFVGLPVDITINWSTAEEILSDSDLKPEKYEFIYSQDEVNILMEKSEIFAKAYAEDGLTAEEFKDYGPVAFFRDSFVEGWNKIVAMAEKG